MIPFRRVSASRLSSGHRVYHIRDSWINAKLRRPSKERFHARLFQAEGGGRGMTMGESAGKRRCKSAKASDLPTKNRSARPELQNAIGPTLQKGWGTRKSRFVARRLRSRPRTWPTAGSECHQIQTSIEPQGPATTAGALGYKEQTHKYKPRKRHPEKQTTIPAGRRSCRRKSGAARAQKPQVCRQKTVGQT